MIEARSVTKSIGEQAAVQGVDLSVPAGVIVGLIGPSGCGKTTLVRLLTGIARPTEGEVRVFGEDPATLTVRQRMRFGYMPQQPVLFPQLSLWGNLNFIASVYGLPVRRRRRRMLELLEFVELAEHRGKRLAETSGGMQRRLALASTLVHDPDLLYLDEPTAGVDPILRERFWSHFRALRDQGKTIVVPTQYVGEARSCDLVAVMAEGRLIAFRPPGGLARLAFGGDPVEVRLRDGWFSGADIDRLRRLPSVRSVRHLDDGVLVVVGDAATDLPELERFFAETNAPVEGVVEHDADLDEVFVRIVEACAGQTQDAA